MLQTHEMRLDNLNASKMLEISNSTTNFAQKFTPLSLPFRGNQNHSRGRYKRDRGHYITGGGRGYNQSSSLNKPLCQICSKTGHTAMKCFYCFDLRYQNPFVSQQAVPPVSNDESSTSIHNSHAYIATPETVTNTTCDRVCFMN